MENRVDDFNTMTDWGVLSGHYNDDIVHIIDVLQYREIIQLATIEIMPVPRCWNYTVCCEELLSTERGGWHV